MRTLVIDTATKACSVALYDGNAVIGSHHEVIGRGHAERLLPFIAALPERGRAEQVVVNVGPGSFTGIRVGVAAARALGLAWGVPVSGYGCLTLVAQMAVKMTQRAASVDVIMSGGHGEYFFQSFDEAGCPSADAVSLAPNILLSLLEAEIAAGDALSDFSATLNNRTMVEILPNAAEWHLALDFPQLPASPIYGRAPDAKLPKGIAA